MNTTLCNCCDYKIMNYEPIIYEGENVKKDRAGIILIDINTGKILLVMGKKAEKWGFPKGQILENESHKECALRELKEEAGIDLPSLSDGCYKIKNPSCILFYAYIDSNLCQPIINDDEIAGFGWFNISCARALDANVYLKLWLRETIIWQKERKVEIPVMCRHSKNCTFRYCQYAHTIEEMKNDEIVAVAKKAKSDSKPTIRIAEYPKMCKHGECCKYRETCKFAHTAEEFPKCKYGRRCNNEKCQFAH